MQTAPYKLLIGDREIMDTVEMANASLMIIFQILAVK